MIQSAAGLLGLALFLFSIGMALAQEGPVPLGPPTERVFDEIPVNASGHIHGVMFGDRQDRPRVGRVRVAINTAEQVLCVEINSQDARYEARRGFDLRQAGIGTFALPMDLDRLDFLGRYAPEQAVILARTGRTCPDYTQPPVFVPAAWGTDTAIESDEQAVVTVYVSTNQNDAYVIYQRPDDQLGYVECRETSDGMAKTAFNKTCRLETAAVDTAEPLRLVQFYFDRLVKETVFRLDFAGVSL